MTEPRCECCGAPLSEGEAARCAVCYWFCTDEEQFCQLDADASALKASEPR